MEGFALGCLEGTSFLQWSHSFVLASTPVLDFMRKQKMRVLVTQPVEYLWNRVQTYLLLGHLDNFERCMPRRILGSKSRHEIYIPHTAQTHPQWRILYLAQSYGINTRNHIGVSLPGSLHKSGPRAKNGAMPVVVTHLNILPISRKSSKVSSFLSLLLFCTKISKCLIRYAEMGREERLRGSYIILGAVRLGG